MKNLNSKITIFSTLLLLISVGTFVNAQPTRLQFTHLTTDEGLSSSIITSIIQDHKGLIWVGTTDGLTRYDGFNFLIYKASVSDLTSLSDNVILTFFEDRNKNLFIGTETGICRYDRDMDQFYNYMKEDTSPLKDMVCSVSEITEDSLGNLWLATDVGLLYFDRIKNDIVLYTYDQDNPESLSNNSVEAVLIDDFSRLWVATRGGLNLFVPETKTFKHFSNNINLSVDLSKTTFSDMTQDKDGNLWLGSTNGLYCLKINSSSDFSDIIKYQNNKNENSSLSNNQVASIFVDYEGNIWVGTENGGINLFDKKNKSFWRYRKDDYDPQSLNNESIETIYQDRSGIMWFGTFTGGLNIALRNRDAIIKYQNLPGAPFSLSHNTVTGFLEDHKGRIWVGTDGGGVNFFDRQNNRFSHFNKDNSELSSNSVLCLMEDSNNRIWMGTWAGGLVRFDPEAKKFTSFTTENSNIQDDCIFAMTEGDNNDLWLCSFENGLIHYEIDKNRFTNYTLNNSGLINEMVVKIVRYSKGRFLLGSPESLQLFSPSDSLFKTYSYDLNNSNSLSYPRITDILVENDSSVWIGTPDGLNLFNSEDESFKRFYQKDGLPDSYIKGLAKDNTGLLWVTTNKGICTFDYKLGKFRSFTKADGLQSNEFTERSILKTKYGALLAGGTKGFNLIYPEKITENKIIPKILITDLMIFNKSVKPGEIGSPLTKAITETKYLVLSHELKVITLSFAVLDFSAPDKNQYAHMMENFDKDWIYQGNKREVTYTNLQPGDYIFRIKGSNNDGLWNESGTSIMITILPPWWSTWWFRLILASAVMVIFISFYLSRIRNLKKQKVLLEKTVEIKTAELKELNSSKNKFFSIIAHDLLSPFNTIIGFSEILNTEIDSGDLKTSKKYSEMINFSAVHTLRLLENLLAWANSQRGNIVFTPEVLNLHDLIKEEYSSMIEIAAAKNIEILYSCPNDLLISVDKNMIKTIIRNLISNAVKFTHRNGRVEVSVKTDQNNVEISVSDNGTGMSRETISKLFKIDGNLSTPGTEKEKGTGLGLILSKEFVIKHEGKIWVESEPGTGSTIKILLPIAK